MDAMLTELCEYLNNYFPAEKRNVTLTIEDGTFTADYLQEGQYFRIIGSIFNDGVHQYPANDLHDETFTGTIWSMAVPATVVGLASKISEWRAKYEAVNSPAMSPFASESFNNYSYSKGTASTGAAGNGNSNSWQSVFGGQLNKWRRLRNI